MNMRLCDIEDVLRAGTIKVDISFATNPPAQTFVLPIEYEEHD